MSRKKILIVENHPLTLKHEKEIIEKMGKYDVICIDKNFEDLTEDFMKKNDISLALLDIELDPEENKISGIDVAKMIRNSRDTEINKIPIFIVSLLSKDADRISKEAKSQMFFGKPCSEETLALYITRFLEEGLEYKIDFD